MKNSKNILDQDQKEVSLNLKTIIGVHVHVFKKCESVE